MKRFLGVAACLIWASAGQTAMINIDTPVNQAIPDGNLAGLASRVSVSGVNGTVGSITVGLKITGTYNGDLYAYLSHGNELVVLLNRPGITPNDRLGYGDHGLDLTFQDEAPNIHDYRQTLGNPPSVLSPLTGTWSPDGRVVNPLLVNGTETPTTSLSTFFGSNPDGDWTLFVADANGGDLNQLAGWSLDLTVVPESRWFGLGAVMICLALAGKQRLPAKRKTAANKERRSGHGLLGG